MPLLHGAHVLTPGTVQAAGGMSTTFALGNAKSAIDGARAAPAAAVPDQGVRDQARGALAIIGYAPGVAPVLQGRVGLPGANEAGIAYTGRLARVDARHAFEDDSLALSIGAGVTYFRFSGNGDVATVDGIDYDGQTLGVDVPLLVGWRSDAGLVRVWAGPRVSYQKSGATAQLSLQRGAGPGPLDWTASLSSWQVGGVVGFAVGFRRIHGVLELDGGYGSVKGSLAGVDTTISGVVLSPAAALQYTF
jgi:hypothetical protein